MSAQITAFPLRPARVHEACGPLAFALAAATAAQTEGPWLWIRENWRPEMIDPEGFAAYADPSQVLLAQVKEQTEGLAVAEEGLRDGAVRLVVLELSAPIGLTAGRRLQLAAQAGGGAGLCLVPEGMGSPATETRWRCGPAVDPDNPPEDSTLQRWELIKNKSGTLGVWHVRWSRSARRLTVVSQARE